MKDREFDDALRDYMQDNTLPYDPLQWDKLSERLDRHEDRKEPRRLAFVPLARWTAGAAAACLAVAAAWYLSQEPPPGSRNETYTSVQPSTEASSKPVELAPDEKLSPQTRPLPAAALRKGRHAKKTATPLPDPGAAQAPAKIPTPAAAETTPAIVAEQDHAPQRTVELRRDDREHNLRPEPPEAEKADVRKLAFGVHGGYNIGQAKNNFTVGINVKQRLGNRLHLETGIALVSGRTETYRAAGFANASTAVSPHYESSSNNIFYLQAAPTINYRIYRGLSAGGGVDAQRLLGDDSKAVSLNSIGQETSSQPTWDFGLTARMDVQLARKLKAGMMYRESVGSVSKGALDAARRNYLLLQLSYTIY